MLRAGIIGGIGPEATVEYYRQVIEGYRSKIIDGSYPEMLIHSVNMTEMIGYISNGDLPGLSKYLGGAVNSLRESGADFAVLASNTPHIVFDEVENMSGIPLISIVRETAKEAHKQGFKKSGLLGTAFTMRNSFYRREFEKSGIELFTPDSRDQDFVHETIFNELVFGNVVHASRLKLLDIVRSMIRKNRIDSMILGCTELPLILGGEESAEAGIPFLNTTQIHTRSIVESIINGRL